MAVLNEEQSMLRDAAKSWVQEKSPVTAFRKMRDSGVELGYDAAAWNEQAEMGWAGVIIPEDFGGSNFGYLSMGLILEEMGRTLTASPLLASGLAAASALILGGNDAQKGEYLPKIADGSLVATLAVDEGAHHAPEKVALTATKSGAGYVLDGKKTFVLEGPAAGLFVVSARTSGKPGDKDGISLFLVPADAKGVSRQNLKLADSRGASNVSFDNVEVGADAADQHRTVPEAPHPEGDVGSHTAALDDQLLDQEAQRDMGQMLGQQLLGELTLELHQMIGGDRAGHGVRHSEPSHDWLPVQPGQPNDGRAAVESTGPSPGRS